MRCDWWQFTKDTVFLLTMITFVYLCLLALAG